MNNILFAHTGQVPVIATLMEHTYLVLTQLNFDLICLHNLSAMYAMLVLYKTICIDLIIYNMLNGDATFQFVFYMSLPNKIFNRQLVLYYNSTGVFVLTPMLA